MYYISPGLLILLVILILIVLLFSAVFSIIWSETNFTCVNQDMGITYKHKDGTISSYTCISCPKYEIPPELRKFSCNNLKNKLNKSYGAIPWPYPSRL